MTTAAAPYPASSRLQTAVATLVPLLAGCVAFVVYARTLAPDLAWANFGGDGGELITAAITLGIPHPPGYPTYVLLGKLWSLLPVPGTMALRFNLFSAAAMTTAVAFAAATVREHLVPNRWAAIAALAAGLTLAFTPLVWGQALIAEVYALNLAAVAALLWSLLGRRASWLSGLLLGLALTTHLTSALLLPLALALSPRSRWGSLLAGTAVGLLPLLALPLLGASTSPVIWGDPTDLRGWLWLVSGQLYRANLTLPANGLSHTVEFSVLLLRQWLFVGWLLVALGLALSPPPRRRELALLLTALLYLLATYFYRTDDARLMLLPVFLLLAPLLGAGLLRGGPLALLLPAAMLFSSFTVQDLSGGAPVRQQARAVLAATDETAVLLTPGDSTIFTLWYFQHIEGLRPDVTLVDANLLAFDWYRQRLHLLDPALQGLEQDNLARFRALNAAQRPFCDALPGLNPTTTCSDPVR